MLKKNLFIFFLFIFSALLFADHFDLNRASATSIPSGAASMAKSFNLSAQQKAVELRALFSDAGSNRACWDFPIKQDLSQLAAIRIRYRCFNIPTVSQFNIYILAGRTWYSCQFAPEKNGQWEELILPKSLFLPEGKSDSWKNCSKIRIAAWRGAAGTFLMQFASLEFFAPNVNIAMLRSAGKTDQQKEAYQYAAHLGKNLSHGGLYPAVLEEDDCSVRILYPYELLLLPSLSFASPSQNNSILSYLRNNGKAAVFHSLPPLISTQMSMPSGTFLRSANFHKPLAFVAPVKQHLPAGKVFRQQSSALIAIKATPLVKVNAWWYDSEGNNTAYPAIVESSSGFWMTHVFLNQDTENAFLTLLAQINKFVPNAVRIAAHSSLNKVHFTLLNSASKSAEARKAFDLSREAFYKQEYTNSLNYSWRCAELLAKPAIPELQARQNEFRAVWCRSTEGLSGRGWKETIKQLKSNNIDAIFPNFAHAFTNNQGKKQLITSCINACKENNVEMHLWLSCLGIADFSAAEQKRFADAGLLQENEKGQKLPWLCPSNIANRRVFINSTLNLIQEYPLDGLHLDLIRYPGSQGCYCKHCRQQFSRVNAKIFPNWPAEVLEGGTERQKWLEFRRAQISSLVYEIRQLSKKVRPEMKLSAAVYTDWQNARSTVGQDWVNWQKNNYLDFVCPMNYRSTTALLAADLQRQKQQLGNLQNLVSGIGVSTDRLSLDELSNQINYTRYIGTAGFILFEYTPREAYDLLPALRKKN